MNKTIRLLALAVVAVGLVACQKEPPPAPPPKTSAPAPAPAPAPAAVSVASATLGAAVGADKKVTQAKESFARNDTIYVSVDTAGSGTADLKARWTYTHEGKAVPVKEDTQTIVATGPSTTEFHVSKPDGWPVGDYQVEVLLGDQPVQTKKFSVR
jgi:hypothetical protein